MDKNLCRAAKLMLVALLLLSAAAHTTPAIPAAERQSKTEKPKQVPLSDKDRALLEGLLKSLVFDPKAAKRVRVEWIQRGAWGELEKVNRARWLVKSQGKTQARVYFADGLFIFAPEGKGKIGELNFLEECNKRIDAIEKENDTVKKGSSFLPTDPEAWKLAADFAADSMRRNSRGEIGEPDLVLAVWLYRLGHNDWAARTLQHARETRDSDSIQDHLQKELAWAAFARLVHCFMVGEDDEALRAGERLLTEIPGGAAAFPWAKPIVLELKHRKTKGTFGKVQGDLLPKGFPNWKVEKKIAFLVDALEDVSARQAGQPGFGVPLGRDPRVRALVKIGDRAMPALLDVIENDDRLTRSVGFWRDFFRQRHVETVRSAARCAVAAILGVPNTYYWPVARLRRFWKESAAHTKAERLMKILTDPNSGFEEARQAADKFTHLDEYDDEPAETYWQMEQDEPQNLDPRIAKLTNPTVAEAILTALDRDLARFIGPEAFEDSDRERVENTFLDALADMGDRRIATALERRYKQAKHVRMRHRLAYTAYRLGNPRPMIDFAREVEEGSLKLPKSDREYDNDSDRPEIMMIRGIVMELSNVDLPEANRALYALADPQHAYYPVVSQRVLNAYSGGRDSGEWCWHPFCLTILRKSLDDMTPAGAKYQIKDGRLSEQFKTGSFGRPIPDFLADPNSRLSAADGRVCDLSAARLTATVLGISRYHRLLKDADTRLEEVKRRFDRHMKTGFRRFFDESTFIPHIPPLGRPATDKDVKEGRAIFHLDGKGKLSQLRLPAVAVIKDSKESKDTKPLLWYQKTKLFIYQAEIDEQGMTHYGVCSRDGIKTVTGDKLTEIREVRHPAKVLIAFPPPKAKSK